MCVGCCVLILSLFDVVVCWFAVLELIGVFCCFLSIVIRCLMLLLGVFLQTLVVVRCWSLLRVACYGCFVDCSEIIYCWWSLRLVVY